MVEGFGGDAVKMIQFGCGNMKLPPPWENYDREIDVTKPLPFESDSVDFIFHEMLIEHLKPVEAWDFLDECYRILKPGGVVRVTFPDFAQNWEMMSYEWMYANQQVTGCGPTRKENARTIIASHGHQSVWCALLMNSVLRAIGFKAYHCELFESPIPELCHLEQHPKTFGVEVSKVESCSVEGVKPWWKG